jgi:hypothetical protein
MAREKAILLLKQLLAMLPSAYWCAILPNKHTDTCLSKVFGLSNFEVETILFYAGATGQKNGRWGFNVTRSSWSKYHTHLDSEYFTADYMSAVFVSKGSPIHKNPQVQIKARSRCPIVIVLSADMLADIKRLADEYALIQPDSKCKATHATYEATPSPKKARTDSKCKATRATDEETPPPKKPRTVSPLASKLQESCGLLSKIMDFSDGQFNVEQLNKFTRCIIDEMNLLHKEMKSPLQCEVADHNNDTNEVSFSYLY